MSGHAVHRELRGYLIQAILQDGCPECDARAEYPIRGLLALDPENMLALWQRMMLKEYENVAQRSSDNDHDLMIAAYGIARFMERLGIRAEDVAAIMRRESAVLVVEVDGGGRPTSYFERHAAAADEFTGAGSCPEEDDFLRAKARG